ncbi:hypothetical protein B4U84_11980 [Westiellopsis prolifica IICB1]|nr:hypothetical protein B4U84_11980 [Westiellopsis prolifica IICB1]
MGIGDRGSGKVRPFKGRFFSRAKIVENFLNCLTWFGHLRIFKSAEIIKIPTLERKVGPPLGNSEPPLPKGVGIRGEGVTGIREQGDK